MKTISDTVTAGSGGSAQAKRKKQITINIDTEIIEYFKDQAESSGIPYQNLINLYLLDCVSNGKRMQIIWK